MKENKEIKKVKKVRFDVAEKEVPNNNDESIKKPFLINVEFGDMTAKGHIYNKFDYEAIGELYKKTDEDGIPIIYPFMYKYLKQLDKKKTIVTFSPDASISASTIAGMSEKYMYVSSNDNMTPKYKSKLKIIYITSKPHLDKNIDDVSVESFTNSIVSNLMCQTGGTFTEHKLVLEPEQFIFVGLDDNLLSEGDKESLAQSEITFLSMDRIKKIGIDKLCKTIIDVCDNDPVHVVFDLTVMDVASAPYVTRFLKGLDTEADSAKISGLTLGQLDQILDKLSVLNIAAIDITSYNFKQVNFNDIAYRITCETARRPLLKLLKFKEKTINIFNENTRFLIWRPRYQSSPLDLGWFILRNVSLRDREEILKYVDEDTIMIMTIQDDDGDDIDAYVSATSMKEQEQKTYVTAEKIEECTLFYEEKVHMMFELLNTTENSMLT